jgi:hypothetical protein
MELILTTLDDLSNPIMLILAFPLNIIFPNDMLVDIPFIYTVAFTAVIAVTIPI